MNLGLGLIAADQYFKAGDERVLRDRAQRRFDWETQRAESEMSLLPSRTEALRTGNEVTTATNQRQLDNRDLLDTTARSTARRDATLAEGAASRAPTEVGTAGTNAQVASRNAEFTLEQLPVVQQTARAQQALGLGNANAALARMPNDIATADNQSRIARELSQFNVNDLPRVIGERIRAGAISDAQAVPVTMAALYDLVAAGDSAAVVKFVNDMSTARGGASAMKIGGVTVENGNLVFTDPSGAVMAQPNGKRMEIPLAALKAQRDRLAKTEFHKVDDALVTTRDGAITGSYRPPGQSLSSVAKQGPMQRDTNYLMTEHGYSKERALAMLREGKTMSKQQFIATNIANRMAMSGEDEQTALAKLSALYDRIQTQEGRGGSGAASPAGGITPQIRSLIGAP